MEVKLQVIHSSIFGATIFFQTETTFVPPVYSKPPPKWRLLFEEANYTQLRGSFFF